MKLGIALSGGGVLGAAHIGVLEELERQDMQVNLIAGTSAGAIIGVLYAAGGLVAVNSFIERLAAECANPRAFLPNVPQKLFSFTGSLLSEYLPDDLTALHIPFYPVATDIAVGTRTVFTYGSPVATVLASAAYPGVFPIQELGGIFYVDGGLTVNLPADVVKTHGAEMVIGSSIYALPKLSPSEIQKMSRVRIAGRSLDILQAELARQQEMYCDFCFNPPVSAVHSWFNPRAILAVREKGRRYARLRGRALARVMQSENMVVKV